MVELPLAAWSCAVCGSVNESPVDGEPGSRQRLTEDCRVCCRPNLVTMRVSEDGEPEASAEFDE